MKAWNTPPPALPKGMVLDGRFELGPRLGCGSFGEVYQARQLVFGRPLREVAIKLFAPTHVTANNVQEVFRDALTLLELQEQRPNLEVQRHLIQVFDMGLLGEPSRAFLSMQLVRGKQTVVDAVRRHELQGMPAELALMFLRQLLIPLAWMHTLPDPIMHGDLKPDNILLTDDKQLVLTDFGLAARLSEGIRGGALAYQAPETLAGLPGGPAADMYAVGLIWCELLTGASPFANVGLAEQAARDREGHLHQHLLARDQLADSLSRHVWTDRPGAPQVSKLENALRDHPQLKRLLHRCLPVAPSDRWQDAKELLQHLDQYERTGQVAAPVFQAADTRPPELIAVRKLLADGHVLLEQGCHEAALESFQRAAATGSDLMEAWEGICQTALALHRRDLAQEAYVAAQKAQPKATTVTRMQIALCEFDGKRELAIALRKRLSESTSSINGQSKPA